MKRAVHLAGLLLASLTVATVALSQQSGGAPSVAGHEAHGAAGTPLIAQPVEAQQRARLSRAIVVRRDVAGCLTQTCNEPPPALPTAVIEVRLSEGCRSDDRPARDRNGRPIRRICEIY